MKTSDQIDQLAAALVKAQAGMHGAVKDTKNTFFKSSYADLESVWTACRKALTDNGLSVIQGIGEDGGLHTRLVHTGGQWIESTTPIKAKDDSPQALGSAITYARRYALAAICGVYQTDDDAEAAMGRKQPEVTADPRGDLSNVDTTMRDRHVSAIADILGSDADEYAIAEMLRAYVADHLQQFQEMYISVADELASRKIIAKAKLKDYLKIKRAA